jgi:nitroreductase
MKVSEAVAARRSIRAFTDEAIEPALIESLLERSARTPSGGNLQPWRIRVVMGSARDRFLTHLESSQLEDRPEYAVYPKDLKSPYRDTRFQVGEDMYALLGIPREDKAARFAHLARNYRFFDAPVGLFCFVDRQMGPPQWSDLGMFLQTFMLLAQEEGLDTCAQEAWAMRAQTVAAFFDVDDDWMLFSGMAIGHRDQAAPVNDLVSQRLPLADWATVVTE